MVTDGQVKSVDVNRAKPQVHSPLVILAGPSQPLQHAGAAGAEIFSRVALVAVLVAGAQLAEGAAYLVSVLFGAFVFHRVRQRLRARAGAPLAATGGTGGTERRWVVGRAVGEAVGWLVFRPLSGMGGVAPLLGGIGHDPVFGSVAGTVAAVVAGDLASRYLAVAATSVNARLVRLVAAAVTVVAVALAVVELAPHGQGIAIGTWVAVSMVMFAVAGLTLLRTQYAWQLPERVDHVDLDDTEPAALRFSLIIPARDEPVLGRTLDQILAGDYPHDLLELLLVVSDDEVDRETRAIAEDYAALYPNVRVLSPAGTKRSKPISLEDARRRCTGDLIGVVDAESLFARGVLAYVNTLAVRHPDVGIFQGGVQLMNIRATDWQRPRTWNVARIGLDWLDRGTSWWRARNCLEYYIWFMSRLRYQAAARFIPLGGNTVFARRSVLDELGGWDVSCLTEDCDLGVRASVNGVKTTVFYHPALTTQEETPESLSKLIIQRTRWMMGFMQVLGKGDWRALPGPRQRLLALEMLSMPFFQAFSGFVLPVSILLAFTLDAPVGFVILYYLPLGVTIFLIIAEEAAFREFMGAYGMKARLLDSVRLVLFAPLYQFVLSIAAVRATIRLLQGKFDWEKTSHVGAHHLAPVPATELEGVS